MRYLPTLLLTTTLLTTTTTYVAATTLEIEQGTSSSSNTAVIAQNAQAQINAVNKLVSATSDFNVSNVLEILFSPDLFPFISWRSATKDEAVVAKLKEVMKSPFKIASERKFSYNTKLTTTVLLAILFPDFLEKTPPLGGHETQGVAKPTLLNEVVDGSLCWGDYRNDFAHHSLTLYPAVRLKFYLELLYQTNVTPDSLGHVLRATTELLKMFMTEPNAALVDGADLFKEAKVSYIHDDNKHGFKRFETISLEGIHTQTTPEQILQPLTHVSKNLSRMLLDESVINRTFTSFEPDALTQFRDIFERIATHQNTKAEDTLKTADTLLTITVADEAIDAYRKIAKTINTIPFKEDKKCTYLLRIGLGLHKAGVVDESMDILLAQINWLVDQLNSKKYLLVNTDHVISATEILLNTGKFERDTAFNLIHWAVYNTSTGAFLHEAIIHGAEVAERLGDKDACRNFLSELESFGKDTTNQFKDRIASLEAKLSTAAAMAATTE